MDSTDFEEGQPPNPTFLIFGKLAHDTMQNTCPSAKSMIAFSIKLGRVVVIQVRCKRWGCRHCGERKVTHFGWRCEDAKPNRLITLTVSNSLWSSPRAAYDGTKGKVTQLAIRLRRKFGEFEYFKVLEVTKKGWPHYHLVVRSEYIPHQVIARMWQDLTGATIVDVRKIKKSRDVFFYVMKYLAKQRYIPWTTRRVSWSKNFFPPMKFKGGKTLDLVQVHWNDEHPDYMLKKYFHPFRIEAISSDCWAIETGKGEIVGTPISLARRKKTKPLSE